MFMNLGHVHGVIFKGHQGQDQGNGGHGLGEITGMWLADYSFNLHLRLEVHMYLPDQI